MQKCSMDAGKAIYNDYTTDPKSPNFIKSLSSSCSKGNLLMNKIIRMIDPFI
ncbi:hypothetical protein BC941DRAFT_423059 [Chlamydoabsidia padenii]|nr:hypothetical protein BC941DRAFT_423059 [Chlamydoabsidia padenii]